MFSQPRKIQLATPYPALPHDNEPRETKPKETKPKQSRSQLNSKPLYFALLEERGPTGQIDAETQQASRNFLQQQLRAAETLATDFPDDVNLLPSVLHRAHEKTAQEYRRYLEGRQAGRPRRYFSCRSHGLYFLRAVAPTKLVDGAWLYGLLQLWQDPRQDHRLAPLIQIYLEELGCGQAAQNHVLLYQRLLARYGCEAWQEGADENFTQGAVQLALAHHADEFLPEIIGFNLGYEQLPLHLLITAYELNELDIDPYYFSLHVTIDNASTGHARKALQSVQDCAPRMGDVTEFHQRVANGYRLNSVGMGTLQAIAAFDLEQELLRVLASKALTGAKLHSDYCLIGGRPVSDWLASPHKVSELLSALQSTGWIRRGEDPQHSRFWRLLTDEQAPMFGVFDGYEQQLLRDWIKVEGKGMPKATLASDFKRKAIVRNPNRFRQSQLTQTAEDTASVPPSGASFKQIIAHHRASAPSPGVCADVDILFQQLAGVNSQAEAFSVLNVMLSPANHPTPAGLVATRLYADLFSR